VKRRIEILNFGKNADRTMLDDEDNSRLTKASTRRERPMKRARIRSRKSRGGERLKPEQKGGGNAALLFNRRDDQFLSMS